MRGFSSKKNKLNKLIAWITLGIFSLQPALSGAQAVADTSAAANNRPTVNSAQNGTKVVQITAPSKAGISRNLYLQFDIDSKGLILNNSFAVTKTQLAGYIQGNSNLAGGSARIILNEVTGSNISKLGGYLEVAGQRADVIIANRNGIVGNGFGFINTGRGVLTTGTPVFGGSGSLDAFRVTGGNISIEGKGINATQTDRVDLISRAVKVNAGIWAKELNVVTGSNNVANNTLNTQAISGDNNQPQVALDVSALGGMFANKIKLVGTEHGVGVNSQGTLSAARGDLILNNNGKITLGGKINASGNITINSADDIKSTGTVIAGNTIKVDSKAVNNTGTLKADSLTINAETIANTGNPSSQNQSGAIITAKNVQITTKQDIVNQNGKITGNTVILVAGRDIKNETTTKAVKTGDNSKYGSSEKTIAGQTAEISATGNITMAAGQDVQVVGGQLTAGKNITIGAGRNLNIGTVTTNEKTTAENYLHDITTNIVSDIKADGKITMTSKQDVNLTSAQVEAGQDLTIKSTTGNININTVSDKETLDEKTGSSKNWTKKSPYDEIVLNSSLQAGGNINVSAVNQQNRNNPNGGNVNIESSDIYSDTGAITINADKNVTIQEAVEQHVSRVQTHKKKRSKKTDTLEYSLTNEVEGSSISGDLVDINSGKDLTVKGSKITGNTVNLVADRDIKNETTTKAVKTGDNYGSSEKTIAGQTAEISATGTITMAAGQDVQVRGGQLTAGKNITIDAGRNLNIGTVATNEKTVAKNYLHDITTNIVSTIQADGKITMTSKQDANLSSAQIEAGKDLTLKSTSGNININTVSDKETLDEKTGSSKNWTRKSPYDEIVLNSSLQARGNINISAVNQQNSNNINGGNINIASSDIYSDTGAITINADKNVTIQEAVEQHVSRVQTHKKKRRLFSSKTTDTLDYSLTNEVEGSSISGDLVDINAGKDLTVKGSTIVGTKDVTLYADHDVNLAIAKKTGADGHYKKVKKSGIFGGGGFLGITIGKQSTTTKLDEQVKAEIGNTIGSVTSNVNITAGNNVKSEGALITSGKDTNITGKDVTIDNSVDTYDSQYKYEFKQSGLSISLGGDLVDAGTNLTSDIERAGEVQDKRLKALYEYKAIKDLNTLKRINKDLQGKLSGGLQINVSIGSSKKTKEQTIHEETVNMSSLTAGGNVSIKATNGNVNLDATSINAANVKLDAKKDLNIGSARNIKQTNTNTKSSSTSVGVSVTPTGTVSGGNIGGSSSKEKENEEIKTYTESVIIANDIVILKSDNDTNILGSQVKGKKVFAFVGANLNIASQQDTETYKAKNQSGGLSVGIGKDSITTGSVSTGKTDSDYRSVTDQAGIFAGDEGFDIYVGKNTDLKGAVISSDAIPDKNRLSTGTLTWSDIKNHAEYKSSSIGVSYSNDPEDEARDRGLTPNIGIPASGDASSITRSAVSQGTIEVRSGNIKLSGLSRNTDLALNALDKIFDKKTVKERQELAQVFGEEAFDLIGDIADAQIKKAKTKEEQNKWKDGGEYKVLLHTIAGAITAELGGGKTLSGAAGAGLNEALAKYTKGLSSDQQQWVSAFIGIAAGKIAGGNATSGASTAVTGTKWNRLTHPQMTEAELEFLLAQNSAERVVIEKKYAEIGKRQDILDGVQINGEIAANPSIFKDINSVNFSLAPEAQAAINELADAQERVDTSYAYGYITIDQRNSATLVINEKTREYQKASNNGIVDFASTIAPLFIKSNVIGEAVDQVLNPRALNRGDLSASTLETVYSSAMVGAIEKGMSLRSKPQYVYVLTDEGGKVKYVGRTTDPDVRKYQHNNPAEKYWDDEKVMGRKGLDLKVVHEGTLSWNEARGLEQALFEHYGGTEKLLNKINPVRPILQDSYKGEINWSKVKEFFRRK